MRRRSSSLISKLIDGRAIAAVLRTQMKADLRSMQVRAPRPPSLAMVVVGERADSLAYIRMKKLACAEVGIGSETRLLNAHTEESQLLNVVAELNERTDVDGVLVQFPLPTHIDSNRVIESVSQLKDVDGLHPANFGKLFLKGCEPLFVPCTPLGCMELLRSTGVPLEGKRAVILGRSNIVGTPMAALLQRANATVSILHSKTASVIDYTSQADIVISAVGHPQIWTKDYFKPGSLVIDVGSNLIPDAAAPLTQKLVGDVAFADVLHRVARITPVPGGVGPMTITMLLKNTVSSWKRRFNL